MGMTTQIILAYAAVTAGFWVHSLAKLATSGRRREPLFGLGERVVLAMVALVTAALWGALLPVYAAGRAQLAIEGRGRGMVRGLRLRPAHRSA